jgi:hypothetical protein
MTSDDRPIYSSATFAGSYSSTVIRLLPPLRGATSESTSPRCTLYAFSNRGYLLTATLKVDALGMVEVEGAEETVSEVKANDVEFVDFEDEGDGRKRRRAVVWERAGHRLVILEQTTEVRDRYLVVVTTSPSLIGSIPLAGFATTAGNGLPATRSISPFFTTDDHMLSFARPLPRRQYPRAPFPLSRTMRRLRLGNDLGSSPRDRATRKGPRGYDQSYTHTASGVVRLRGLDGRNCRTRRRELSCGSPCARVVVRDAEPANGRSTAIDQGLVGRRRFFLTTAT